MTACVRTPTRGASPARNGTSRHVVANASRRGTFVRSVASGMTHRVCVQARLDKNIAYGSRDSSSIKWVIYEQIVCVCTKKSNLKLFVD